MNVGCPDLAWFRILGSYLLASRSRGPTELVQHFAKGGVHKGSARHALIWFGYIARLSQRAGGGDFTCGVDENWFIENSNTVTLLSLVMLVNLSMMIKAREMRA
jgi:hypothetical protein